MKNYSSLVGAFILVSIFVAGIYGWIENVVKIIHTVDMPITGMFILRCIGILIAPLGAILGFF